MVEYEDRAVDHQTVTIPAPSDQTLKLPSVRQEKRPRIIPLPDKLIMESIELEPVEPVLSNRRESQNS